MKHEMDVFDYVDTYRKEWKKMVIITGMAIFITIIVTFIQPAIYKSTLIVLSPKEGAQAINLGKYLGLSGFSGSSNDEVIFSMLKSRRMRKDIDEYIKPRKKGKSWWSIDTYIVTGGFAVEVKGPDPALTRDIANFAIQNLDKINMELQVTTQKPMAKVLDSAVEGAKMPRNLFKKAVAAGLIVFLMHSCFIFFREYFYRIKK